MWINNSGCNEKFLLKVFFETSSTNSLRADGSIEQDMSGPSRNMLSVKCLSSIEAPKATAPKHV